ncbi:response regulator [Arthrobacter sp. KNU-44]|uniref:response regulator n=1 Tax=Arthrobacter sp. KNU-44 TaxID=3450744 RepID=UPI003F4405DA
MNNEAPIIRVFIVDDHAVVRRGLASYLSGEDGIDVIGQAENGRQALDELAILVHAGTPPSVVLMDLLMPEMDGIETTKAVTDRWPELRVIAVTSFLEEEKISAALDAGASGYLLKDADADDVLAAIRNVAAGKMVLQPEVATTMIAASRRPNPAADLTGRERDVIVLVAKGYTNQQIATRLSVTERTARTHVSNILAKLGLTSRTQAAMWAVQHRLLSPAGSEPNDNASP